MDLKKEFNKAAERVTKLRKKPSDEILLKIYGLYKQATVGPNKSKEPSSWDFKSKAKWNAWKKEKDLSKEEAMKKYIYLVNKLIKND